MSSEVASSHYGPMAEALRLARRGLLGTAPNPQVGCVIVQGSEVVGRGWHRRAGEPHAEIHALAEAGDRARGATVYVTLEPCSHTGRTPPCAEALINADVARVVMAVTDANPQVSGSGAEALRRAGIEVLAGVLEDEARALNAGFFKRMSQGLPLLRCKLAMSLDGRTAMASGESQWITGPDARAQVQFLRARSCAVMTGIGTVLADDCSLRVREDELPADRRDMFDGRQPLRVVLDSHLRTPTSARVLGEGRCLILHCGGSQACAEALREAGAEVVRLVDDGNARLDPEACLRYLAEKEQCNEVLLEAGAELCGAFQMAALIDEYRVFIAPTLLGSNARPLLTLPLDTMAEQQGLQIDSVRAVGRDWLITARPAASTTGD